MEKIKEKMVKLGRVFEEPFLEDMYEKDAIKAHMRPNFVLIPVFVFLGIDKINSHTKKVSFLPSTLLRAFNIDSTKLSIEEKKISHKLVLKFIKTESAKIKRDHTIGLVDATRTLDEVDLANIIVSGFKIFSKNSKGKNLHSVFNHLENIRNGYLCTSKIARYILNGRKDKNWYEENSKIIKKILPSETDFGKLFDMLAITSMMSSLESNVTMGLRAYHELTTGKEFSKVHTVARTVLERYRTNGGKILSIKIRNFSEAMRGNKNAVIVDMWQLRAFGIEEQYTYKGRARSTSPKLKDALRVTEYIRELAKIMHLEPRQLCSMIWGGVRTEQSSQTNTVYWKVIEKKYGRLFNEIEI